jgi:two-component system chemotaxis sensor kinase CheA
VNPTLPPQIQSALLDDFFVECDEHLSHVRDALVRLESSVGKAQADATTVEELFRSFHSFKGISAIVGLTPAEEIAHSAEDFLRSLSKGGSLTGADVETLMGATQKLEQTVGAFRDEAPLPDHETTIRHLRELRKDKDLASGPDSSVPHSTPDSVMRNRVDEARAKGLVIWRCTFGPSRELDERGVNLNTIRERLTRTGEILQCTSQVRGENKLAFEFLVGMPETPANIASWEVDGVTTELLEEGALGTFGKPMLQPPPESFDRTHSPFIAPSHVVRVDLNRLDDLMRITGELVIHRSKFEDQLTQALRLGQSFDGRGLQEVNGGLARSLRELREAIMRVRLVPIAEVFARMPFVIRDLSRGTSKLARLKLEGEQTEIDKYLIERLKDPLLHLVRNAFSHGLETKEERVAAGKPPEGVLELRASTSGDSVVIKIRDDGRGINPESIAHRAALAGLQVPSVLDGPALLRIICSPGFSTQTEVDRASGRGVGMSVVYNTVRELGGSIGLESEVGKGTQFTLRLPFTLTIAEALILSAAGQTCAIPQGFVSEVLPVSEEEVWSINQTEVIAYRSGVLPILRLDSIFGLPRSTQPRQCLLVLSSENGRTGLVADRIHGQREIVVRALRDPLLQVPGIAGATELGDGRPVLILDGAVLTSGVVRPHLAETKNGGERLAVMA